MVTFTFLVCHIALALHQRKHLALMTQPRRVLPFSQLQAPLQRRQIFSVPHTPHPEAQLNFRLEGQLNFRLNHQLSIQRCNLLQPQLSVPVLNQLLWHTRVLLRQVHPQQELSTSISDASEVADYLNVKMYSKNFPK